VIVPFSEIRVLRDGLNGRVVVTNGVFDVFHPGHLGYLQKARKLGDFLIVGVDDDDNVRRLKGPHRPVHKEQDRAELLSELRCVDYVCTMPRSCDLIFQCRPDIYVKGGDYTLDTLNPHDFLLLKALGSKIVFMPLLPGHSTSSILNKT